MTEPGDRPPTEDLVAQLTSLTLPACAHYEQHTLPVGDDHRYCLACGSLWFRYGGWLPFEPQRRVDDLRRHLEAVRAVVSATAEARLDADAPGASQPRPAAPSPAHQPAKRGARPKSSKAT